MLWIAGRHFPRFDVFKYFSEECLNVNMGSSLPPAFAEKDFYHIFFVMAGITVIAVVAVLWRKSQHRKYYPSSANISAQYPWAYEWLARGLGAL
jgi:hypothetical protein